jgi:hypothetical protein
VRANGAARRRDAGSCARSSDISSLRLAGRGRATEADDRADAVGNVTEPLVEANAVETTVSANHLGRINPIRRRFTRFKLIGSAGCCVPPPSVLGFDGNIRGSGVRMGESFDRPSLTQGSFDHALRCGFRLPVTLLADPGRLSFRSALRAIVPGLSPSRARCRGRLVLQD